MRGRSLGDVISSPNPKAHVRTQGILAPRPWHLPPKRGTTFPHKAPGNITTHFPAATQRREAILATQHKMPVGQALRNPTIPSLSLSLLTGSQRSPTSHSAQSKSSPKRRSRTAPSRSGSVYALATPSGSYFTSPALPIPLTGMVNHAFSIRQWLRSQRCQRRREANLEAGSIGTTQSEDTGARRESVFRLDKGRSVGCSGGQRGVIDTDRFGLLAEAFMLANRVI